MQLVLGAQIEAGLGTAGAPLPAPPERFRLSERGRRALRRAAWIAAFALLVALGALHGATVAIGASGVSELASAGPPSEPAGAAGASELRGSFWRPDASNAQRPPSEVAPRSWQPRPSD
jgi:hypothetical protein